MTKFYKAVRRGHDGILYSMITDPAWRCAYSPGCKTQAPGNSRLWVWASIDDAKMFRAKHMPWNSEIWEVSSRCKFRNERPMVGLPESPDTKHWTYYMRYAQKVAMRERKNGLFSRAYSVRNLIMIKRVA